MPRVEALATADAHFEALRQHFDDEQIVEIVSAIALFGFLDRWNDSGATTLEALPRAFGVEAPAENGWRVDRLD